GAKQGDVPPPSGGGLVLLSPDGKVVHIDPKSAGANELSVASGAGEEYGSPAGGTFSSAADMGRFAEALLQHRLTSTAMASALTTREIVAVPATATQTERDYGFGFGVGLYNGHRWFGHN